MRPRALRPRPRPGAPIPLAPPAVPIGALIAYAAPADTLAQRQALAIAGWLVCDGRARPTIATAPELYTAIGTIYGDRGSGGFAIPDLRGQFLRVKADDQAQDPGWDARVAPPGGEAHGVGSTQPCMVQLHEHAYVKADVGTGGTGAGAKPDPLGQTTDLLIDGTSVAGEETRPTNVYVIQLIRFSSTVGPHNLIVELNAGE